MEHAKLLMTSLIRAKQRKNGAGSHKKLTIRPLVAQRFNLQLWSFSTLLYLSTLNTSPYLLIYRPHCKSKTKNITIFLPKPLIT